MLTILKILGIVLLCVLGLAILVILLVCLVPFRYELKGRVREKAVRARARVHWLLSFLQVLFDWKENKGLLRAKVLGITVMRKLIDPEAMKAEKEKKAAEEAEKETVADLSSEEGLKPPEEETPAEGTAAETAPAEQTEVSADSSAPSQTGAEPAAQAGEPQWVELEDGPLYHIPEEEESAASEEAAQEEGGGPLDTLQELWSKGEAFYEKAEAFLDDPQNQKAIALVKKQLKKLLNTLLPTGLRIDGRIGLKDPAVTGQIIGTVYALAPLFKDSIRLDGVYDKEELDVYAELKGRIRLGAFVEIALSLLLNKTIRGWIKQFTNKEEKKDPADKNSADHT